MSVMKIPYNLVPAVALDQRREQIEVALTVAAERGWPRLAPRPIDEHASLTVACYGPSLRQTWPTLTRPILTVSGALRFLTERGVVPDYHVVMDPRRGAAEDVIAVPGVHYLMCSLCHPRAWEILEGQRVTLWHAVTDVATCYDWFGQRDPGSYTVHGEATWGSPRST